MVKSTAVHIWLTKEVMRLFQNWLFSGPWGFATETNLAVMVFVFTATHRVTLNVGFVSKVLKAAAGHGVHSDVGHRGKLFHGRTVELSVTFPAGIDLRKISRENQQRYQLNQKVGKKHHAVSQMEHSLDIGRLDKLLACLFLRCQKSVRATSANLKCQNQQT